MVRAAGEQMGWAGGARHRDLSWLGAGWARACLGPAPPGFPPALYQPPGAGEAPAVADRPRAEAAVLKNTAAHLHCTRPKRGTTTAGVECAPMNSGT